MTTNNINKNFSIELKKDFRKFMTLLWEEMNLPKPTKMQLLFADTLQKSTARKLCLLGYRGFSKTTITAAFLLWKLYRDPRQQVAIWGSNQDNAGDTTQLMLKLVQEVPWLKHLAPTGEMDQSALSFDVKGRGIYRGSSVMAFGIGGSVTGTRADLLVVDDPETSTNGDTAKKRIAIDRAMNEASYVIKDGGQIIVLGTIHFDDSIYTRLMGQGYKIYLFPMAVPDIETQRLCWDYYLQPIQDVISKNKEGSPLDRFNKTEIELKRETGLINFMRQCLVNPFRTSLSRKPLDMRKIIVFQADNEKLPIRFYHSNDEAYLDEETMNYSSASLIDKLYKPYKFDDTLKAYEYKLMYIDPAGAGKDETAVVVVGVCGGYAVLMSVEGLVGGASNSDNIDTILETARRFKVNEICIEDNFGQGMYAQLLRAEQGKKYSRFGRIEDIIPISTNHVTKKKEQRILNTLDPIINNGRLVITPSAFIIDYESANKHVTDDRMMYRLSYQISYFAEGGNELEYDDRIDALASAIEKLKSWLTDATEINAETYDDYIIKKAFEEDEMQLERPSVSNFQPLLLQSRQTFL